MAPVRHTGLGKLLTPQGEVAHGDADQISRKWVGTDFNPEN